MSLPRPLLNRLHRDLAELLDSPYPGVTVFTDDADIQKLCLILTPPSGPWKDLALHFDVKLPDNWVWHDLQLLSMPRLTLPLAFFSSEN